MPADNPRRRNLVVVKTHRLGWITKQILLEVSINAAKHGMRNHRAMLVVRAQPFRSAHKKVLLPERSPDRPTISAVGVGRGATGAHVSPPRCHNSPVPVQPVRTF